MAAAEVGPDKPRDWYRERDLLNVPGEIVVDGMLTQQKALDALRLAIGPVDARPEVPDSFLP